jgi:transcriptional regulator with XRE-family HTH domain
VYGWELRDRRRRAGSTLAAVARAAGTSETNLSAYERGAKRPNAATLRRLSAIIDAGAGSTIHQNALLTVPAAAAALRHGIKAGWDTADLLRIVREMIAHAKFAVTPTDEAAFLAAPSTTGDQRWDALLAGAVEDLALRDGRDVPEWTKGHALPTFWFVGSLREMDAYSFGYSPFPLQVRGVMIDPADLASV